MAEKVVSRVSRRILLSAPIVVLALAACGSSGSRSDAFYVRISGRIPAITGVTLAGAAVRPADFARKVVVANFWNPDCGPCRLEQPLLQSAWRRFGHGGVQFVGLMFVGGSWPNDPEVARAYVRRFGVTYPTMIDRGSTLARGFGVPGIPVTYVADATGRLRYKVIGQLHPGQVEQLIRMAGG